MTPFGSRNSQLYNVAVVVLLGMGALIELLLVDVKPLKTVVDK